MTTGAEPRERARNFDLAQPRVRVRITDSASSVKTEVASLFSTLTKTAKDYEQQSLSDPFEADYTNVSAGAGAIQIVAPPYNLLALSQLPTRSNMLRQCIDAYVVNIDATGYRMEYVGPPEQEDSPESLAEKTRVQELMDEPNPDYGIIELRERNRRDYETIGYYCLEVIRDTAGAIAAYYNLPSHTIRLTTRDREPTEVTDWVERRGQLTKIKRKKYFRRFVQQSSSGSQKVYLKEFGDPRIIDPKTGKVSETLSADDGATEVLYVGQYYSGYTYGVPRYIHQLPSILGSREVELTNLHFFKENAVPSMLLMVSGGALSQQSLDVIEGKFQEAKGRDAQNRIIVLEAIGDEQAAAPQGQIPAPKLEVKNLGADRQNDAVFKEYDEANQAKVRSAFRLPPIFVGLSEELTHATAEASLQMGEAQVFGPERNKVDQVYNTKLLADEKGRPPKYWWVRSNPPRITATKDIVDALKVFDELGALTPNVVIGIANELFNLDIKTIEPEWGSFPFAITKALLQGGKNVEGFDKLLSAIQPPTPEELAAKAKVDAEANKGKNDASAPGGTQEAEPPQPAENASSEPATKEPRVRVRVRA